MRHATINGKPIGPQPSRQVVSRSAILILSGVLIGTSIAQGEMSGIAYSKFCAGMIGIISFLALDLLAQRRRTRVLRKTLAAVDSTLTMRLRRHVNSQPPSVPKCRKLTPIGESSYLPVTLGWG